MGQNVVAGGMQVNGRRIAAYRCAVFAAYGSICHLCGGEGADTVDHLQPVSQRPELRWEIGNARPAHRHCNSARGDSELVSTWDAGW